MNLDQALRRYLPLIEAEMRALVRVSHPSLGPYYGMMQYHLGWLDANLQPHAAETGKRLRPVLCLLVAEALGGALDQVLPAAAGLELLHNFSLVHDDIQDNSLTRRHRPTVWSLWGVPQAINVGDGLFILAHLAFGRLADQGVPPARCLAAYRVFSQACLALCEGQYLDMAFEAQPAVELDHYLDMIHRKTAALLGCAAQLGAMLSTDQPELVALYRCFGENLGMAFQIEDDILGIWGTPEITGKPVADDIRQQKKSLPVVYVLGQGGVTARKLAGLLQRVPEDEEAVAKAVVLLEQAGARAYAMEMAATHHRLAMEALEATRIEHPAQEALRELSDRLLGRQQ